MPFLHSQNGQNDLEGKASSIPGCMFVVNLEILLKICDDLSCRQAELPRILSQNDQSDLEGHSQSPPFSILA